MAVLGYSRRRGDGLHPICAARLEAAERVADGAVAVLLSGWARRPTSRSEAELMAAAWAGPEVPLLADGDARSTLGNARAVAAAVQRDGRHARHGRHVVVAPATGFRPRAGRPRPRNRARRRLAATDAAASSRRPRARLPPRGAAAASAQRTTVERCTAGSLKTSSSSRLALENSVTTAPSGPARNQCSVSGGIVYWSPGPSSSSPRVLDPERHAPAPAPERLLLAGAAVERRVPVLGAGLTGVEDELLRAVAVGVDVDEELQPDLAQPREAEVGHLDRGSFVLPSTIPAASSSWAA